MWHQNNHQKDHLENVVKIDTMNLIIKNLEGLTYEYKRFYPKNYLNE